MTLFEQSDTTGERLVSGFVEARGQERTPSVYRWVVSRVVYERLYDEVAPCCRIEGTSGVQYGPDEMMMRTDYGAVVIEQGGPSGEGELDGEVVLWACDGNAALVREKLDGEME